MTDEIEILGCSALGCHNDAAYCPVCYEGAHLRGLLQGDARTMAALAYELEQIIFLLGENPPAPYVYARNRAVNALKKQPASDALDAAKLAFGELVREECAKLQEKELLPQPRPTIEELEKILSEPAPEDVVEISPTGELTIHSQSADKIRALDLKALLSTVKEEK